MSGSAWRFEIEALPDPQSLPRVLDYFAQRSIVLETLAMSTENGQLVIRMTANDLPEHHAMVLAAKIGQLVLVEAVRLEMRLPVMA
ncbi:MAG: hypothetical protein WBA55_06935, partial [Allopontixanthobacter sediminis]